MSTMWKGRPALFAAAMMAAGFSAGRFSGLTLRCWFVCALVCAIATVAVLVRVRGHSAQAVSPSIFIPVFLFAASALYYTAFLEFEPDHITRYLRLGRPVRITCRVTEEPVMRNGTTSVVVAMLSLTGKEDSVAINGNAVLTVLEDRSWERSSRHSDSLTFAYGDVVSFTALVEEPLETRNPGEVSYREYLALNNVFAVMRVRGYHAITVINHGGSWFYEHVIFPSKHFVARSINATARGEEAKYLTSLLLGDRSDMSREIQQAFANTGTIHVLAVSGSHVAVVVAAIYTLFGIVRIPHRSRILATMAAVSYYMLLTGASPSVARASLMTIVVLAGRLFQRRASVYNCLGASAIAMFLYDPKQVFDVGFQLSFAAVFAMVACYPRLTAWTRIIPRSTRSGRVLTAAVELTAVSVAAQIGTIPFTAFYFEKVSIISFAANLMVVPLAELNIVLGFTGVLFSLVSSWVGSCITELNAVLTSLVLAIVKTSNQIPYAIIHTASFGFKETVLYLLVTLMLFNVARPHVFRRLFLCLFFVVDCLVVGDAFASSRHGLRVTFFDVGQGDAALIEFPSQRPMLIDGGPRTPAYDSGERILLPGLRRRGINSLSSVLITHPHDDHIGGIGSILSDIKADRLIESRQSVLPVMMRSHPGLRVPVGLRHVQRGDVLEADSSVRIYVLHPQPGPEAIDSLDLDASQNNESVVVKICYGTVSFLFMGDAERAVEEDLAGRYGDFLESTVIKLGHHGSSTSSSDTLLHAVNPAEAVISVGRFNAFHHPSPATLRRLARMGIAAHRTDRDGAIVYETDGRQWHRIRWRDDPRMNGLVR